MTVLQINGHVVGWSPDIDPEHEFIDGEQWTPVIDGRLTVLLLALGDAS